MALIWSKKSTGVPIKVKTSHVSGGVLDEEGNRRIGSKISECVLDIGEREHACFIILLLVFMTCTNELPSQYKLYFSTTNRHLQKLPPNHIPHPILQQHLLHRDRNTSPHLWKLDHLQITRGPISTTTGHYYTVCQI